MSDHSELKRLAEAATPGPWAYDGSYVCPARTEDGTTYVELWRSIADCHQPENTKFIAAANPAAVLALIAEVEGLRAQHGRDSAELRSLCQARDDARKERDQLKSEVEQLRGTLCGVMDQVDGNIRATVRDCVNGMNDVQDIYEYCDNIEAIVDLALSLGDQP